MKHETILQYLNILKEGKHKAALRSSGNDGIFNQKSMDRVLGLSNSSEFGRNFQDNHVQANKKFLRTSDNNVARGSGFTKKRRSTVRVD